MRIGTRQPITSDLPDFPFSHCFRFFINQVLICADERAEPGWFEPYLFVHVVLYVFPLLIYLSLLTTAMAAG